MAYVETLAMQLAKLVVEALVRIGLTREDILGGAIKHDNLAWQIPPLVLEATLFNIPLGDYTNAVTHVNVDQLYSLWTDSLALLQNNPDKVVTADGYRATSYAMPNVQTTERQLHLSLPDGFPGGVTEYVGATLSLECAHVLQHNTKLAAFVSDEENYLAILPDGREVGIKDGVPAVCGDLWDLPVSGMVQEMLRTPRGAVWEGCDYNIISKVRSVVQDLDSTTWELEALDWALQTLRVIDGHAELLSAIRKLPEVARTRKLRHALLKDALVVVHQQAITDRQRVETLKQMLVPEVLTQRKFSKMIYPFFTVPPAMLHNKVLTRIQIAVVGLLDAEEATFTDKRELFK